MLLMCFVIRLINEIRDEIKQKMKEHKEILMTDADKKEFETATHCFICGDQYKNAYKNEKEAEKYKKVRDQCHFTGKYRGCAHSICNLNFCNRFFQIPVFFHNMKNYDGHLIIQNAEKLSNKNRIDVIAQNSEKFINIGFDSLSVKDSFSFITASLDKLVSMTKYDSTDEKEANGYCVITGKVILDIVVKNNDIIKTEKCLDLTEKGVYPYEYMNAFDKCNDEQLPSKEQFYSRLTEEDITNDDYNKAKQIWKLLISRTWVNIMICI